MNPESFITKPIAKLFLLPALLAGLAFFLSFPAGAQTFTVLHTFTTRSNAAPNGNPDGANPYAGLLLSGTNLYGTARAEGSFGYYGTLFALNTNGSNFTTLYNFGNNGMGVYPYDGLIISSNTLFGTASGGGSGGSGAVFSYNIYAPSSNYTVLHSFAYGTNELTQSEYPVVINTDGVTPWAGLVLSGTNLYGTAETGSSNANGVIFTVNTNGTVFTNLHIFTAISGYPYTNGDGANPRAGLISSGGMFYGTASTGGSGSAGTVFGINTNGSIFTNLHSFAAASNTSPYGNTDGTLPWGGLAISGNTLYGTATTGGSANLGTLFAININGSGFTNLHSFTAVTYSAALGTSTNSDGTGPYGTLLVSGNTLYGTTTGGGSNGSGTVFQVNTDGSRFTTLYNFTALTYSLNLSAYTNSDGASPYGGLIISGNVLYGTANSGGTNGEGTVFSLALLGGPQLAITHSGTNLVITWPTSATGFTLQSTTNLNTTNWTTVSPAPVIVSGQYTVTNAISGAEKFYRLYQ